MVECCCNNMTSMYACAFACTKDLDFEYMKSMSISCVTQPLGTIHLRSVYKKEADLLTH